MDAVTRAADEAATEGFGADLWKSLRGPACVLLSAPMGAGKTALVRGMLRAAGHAGEVPSPTFAIVQSYETDPPLYHLDLYRLSSPAELAELGIEDMLGAGVVVVEWPERALPDGGSDEHSDGYWPEDALRVTGRMEEDGVRVWEVRR